MAIFCIESSSLLFLSGTNGKHNTLFKGLIVKKAVNLFEFNSSKIMVIFTNHNCIF